MKIKLALLDKDQSYLNRIVSVFSTKYADKLQIYSFTDEVIALSTLESTRIDVLVASDTFEINIDSLPKHCGFAYFTESLDINQINDQRAICKFQKADLIFKQILSVYSERAGSLSGLKFGDESAKVLAFCSPCGGVGTSSMAASAAIYYAKRNQKTLYLNLEKFGSADVFFSGEGQFDMSDVVFALKSKRTNLSLKLESCVRQDCTGVYFYSQPKIALDMHELTIDDIIRLISEVKLTGSYDYIILDMDFAISKDTLTILRQTHAVVFVSDGSEIANSKLFRAYEALFVLEQDNDSSIMNRLTLVYNKFSNKSGKVLKDFSVRNIGGAPRYEHATTVQVLEQLSKMEMFEKIF